MPANGPEGLRRNPLPLHRSSRRQVCSRFPVRLLHGLRDGGCRPQLRWLWGWAILLLQSLASLLLLLQGHVVQALDKALHVDHGSGGLAHGHGHVLRAQIGTPLRLRCLCIIMQLLHKAVTLGEKAQRRGPWLWDCLDIRMRTSRIRTNLPPLVVGRGGRNDP